MAATIDLGPADLGDVPVYLGDVLDISFVQDGEDYANKSFVSHVRTHRRDEDLLVAFAVSTRLLGDDDPDVIAGLITAGSLEITLHLDGDSGVTSLDSPTRLIERPAAFDVQVVDQSGAVGETVVQGRLVPVVDVTR